MMLRRFEPALSPPSPGRSRRRPWLALALLTMALTSWLASAQAMRVLFINPGHLHETYWVDVSRAMQAAADDLGIELDVAYVERDHTRSAGILASILAGPPERHPDYLLLTNDYGSGPALLAMLEQNPIPTLFTLSGIPASARDATGQPRERLPFWLGSLEPRAEDAGYLTARRLIDQARTLDLPRGPDGKWHLLALAGDRSTPTSVARNAGLERALAETDDVVLDQIVYANWRRDTAQQQMRWLLERHPHARLIWGGNDEMAFGAMDVWRARGGRPGHDAVFSGINTSPEAFAAIRSGELTALAGGHFLGGAGALIMLHDYAHGRDFADEGLDLQHSMFTLFDANLVQRFEERLGPDSIDIDFRRLSKVHNPALQTYDFGLGKLLQQAP